MVIQLESVTAAQSRLGPALPKDSFQDLRVPRRSVLLDEEKEADPTGLLLQKTRKVKGRKPRDKKRERER